MAKLIANDRSNTERETVSETKKELLSESPFNPADINLDTNEKNTPNPVEIQIERNFYSQIIGILAVIIVAIFLILLFFYYINSPPATRVSQPGATINVPQGSTSTTVVIPQGTSITVPPGASVNAPVGTTVVTPSGAQVTIPPESKN